MSILTSFIREDISVIPDDINDMQSVALRSYLNYLLSKSLVINEYVITLKKEPPLRQSRADNYIHSNEEIVESYRQIKARRFQTIFKLLAFSDARITELVKMAKEYNSAKLIINKMFAK